jgi:hypothetical protein
MGMVMKKTSRNDITGAWMVSKPNNEQFEKNWDLIFGKKKALEESIKANEELLYELDDGQLTDEQYAKIKELAEYELNKSTGEVQKKED